MRIEPAPANSLPYVLSSWGRTVESNLTQKPSLMVLDAFPSHERKKSFYPDGKPKFGFLRAFSLLQASIIKRSRVLTAVTSDGRIVAYCIFEPCTLHWIYTRKEMRRGGAAKTLLAQAFSEKPIITTWTSDLRHLGLADAPYTPFWLRST